jgi:hypothetical protein
MADGREAQEIMIPGKIIRFLDEHANLAFGGTRSRDLVPFGHRVSGWRLGADGRTLTSFVADQSTDRLIESLEDNGEFALTVEEFPSHETYQFKGRYVRHRPLQPADLEAVDRIRERYVKSMRHLFADAPEALLKKAVLTPSVAVDFEVREVYLQTPGPGAGLRLVPPAERSK